MDELKKKIGRDQLRYLLTGMAMGAADIVPGVSGGTIAFVAGIYEQLIKSVKTLTNDLPMLVLKFKIVEAVKKVPWSFLVPLGIGILISLLSLSRIIEYLLHDQPVYTWAFFFGLILASIYSIGRQISVWNGKTMAAVVGGAILTYLIVGLVPVETPDTYLAFFLAGGIAIVAMILPGISGSFLLLIMGKYQQLLAAVNNMQIMKLLTFVVGAFVGLAVFSKLLNWLFEHYHLMTIAVLTGVMIGSLRKVWPWKETIEFVTDRHGEMIPVVQQNVLPKMSLRP